MMLDAKIASALNKINQNSRFKKRVSLEEQKSPERVPVSTRKTDRLPVLRILPGHSSQWFCRELCRHIYSCSSKWRCSGNRYEMGRNSIVDDTNPTWWHLGRIVQTKNTRVWETQDVLKIFWSQKWKFWNKRRGQESKGKTAWTKKSGRLLAMES